MTTPDHIVVLSLENEDFSTIVGNTANAPFLNQLISEGMLFTNYDGLTHPSQPNYIALFSGSTQGVTNNAAISQFPASVPTLASALAAKGLTFGGYAETNADIERQPWIHFANSAADAQNMSAFPQTAAGFANLPTVSFVTPNDADNMTPISDTGGGVPAGDAWVQANLGAYAAWAQANNSLLIITFDENNTNPAVSYPNHVATIVVGAGVPAGVTNSSQADSYSLLNTIQSLYGLTPVGVSAGAPPLDFYSATPPTATSTVTTSFSGISDPNNYPPENALAVGPQSVLTAESVPYEVTDLSGGAAITKSQFQLFSSLGTTLDNSVFDTRAAYDSSTGRFVMIANNLQPGGTSTNIDIAVSRDSNPADGWYVGSIDTSQGGTVQSDMPYLSVSNGNLYITAPEYSNGPFVGTGEWVVSENSVISGSPQVAASNTTPASAAIMRGVAGANGKTYYLGTYSDGRETALTYQTYDPTNGFSATQTLFLGDSDVGGGGNDYTAAQLGTTDTLDIGDSRIQSLAYASSGGRNYIYGVSEAMPSAGSLAQIEWFKLDVTDPANPQYVIGNVITGASIGANVAVFNPSIAVDQNGDALINFTASGPSMDPSDYYTVWGAGDASFNAPTLYQASTSYFQQTVGATGAQRWGTYSSAISDPASPDGFWISNEYVTNTGVTIPSGLSAWWDTVVTRVQVAPYTPILGGAGSTVTYTQGGAATPLDSALTVQDLGSTTLAGATVAISSGLLTGDSLNFSSQNGITGTYNATAGVLTLSGTASLAAYQAALESITYSTTSPDASNAGADPSRTITWTVTDGARSSTPVTSSIDIGAGSSVTTSFSGISDPTNYPPQNALAIGPQYIVTAETTHYEISTLNGGGASTGSLYTLFSSLGSTLDNSIYDPRAAYDGSTGRYVLTVNNIQPGGATNIDVAVSKDSNPNDGWSVGSVSVPAGNQSDMPYFSVNGIDGNIYLSAPEYPSSGFTGTGQWVVSESSVVNGSPQVLASNTAPASNAIMRNVSGGNGYTYYLGSYSNGSQTELTYQTYSASTGFSPSQTLALGNSDQGAGGSDYTAAQAGTSLTLDAGDGHLQSLAYANGYVYGVSETMPVGASAPVIHWFKLNVSNPASPQLAAQGDLTGALLGSPNIGLFNPSIAVDGTGDVLINFTASGPNMDPSDYYVVQGARDLAFSAPTLYQGSTSYFQQAVGSTGAQRWGAYSSAVADPNNPSGFWISNEYVTNTGVTIPSGLSAWWDTVVAQVGVGAPVSSGPTVVSVATFQTEQSTLDAAPGGFSISDTAANVSAGLDTLSPDGHISSITVTDNAALTVSVAQITSDAAALALVADANSSPYTLAVADSAANVAASLDALNANTHVASIALTGAGPQTLTVTSAQAANDTRALGEITTPHTVVISNAGVAVSGAAAAISAALDSYEASLPASITVTDNAALTVSVAQITSDAAALALVADANSSPYTLAVADSAANVAASLDALNANTHVASIALTGAGPQTLAMSLQQALNDTKALGEIATLHTVQIVDTAANIASITSTQAAALKSAGVTSLVSTTGAVSITIAEALFLLGDGISITGGALTATGAVATILAVTTAQAASLSAGGYALAVVDTAASIHALSATQIGSLGSLHVARISASDTSVPLTAAQVTALESVNIAISAPTGSTVSVTDTSANLTGMSAIVIAGLRGLGVTAIVSSNGTVSMNLAQVIALETAGLRVVNTAAAATVRATDTALAIQNLTLSQISGLPGAGVNALVANDTSVVLNLGQAAQLEAVKLKITAPTGASVSASDTAANVGAFTAAQIAALAGTGVTAINVTDANTVILTVAQVQALEKAKTALSVQSGQHGIIQDTAAGIATLTSAQMAGLSALHITQIGTTDTVAKLTVAQANALVAQNISVSGYQGATVQLYDTSANLLGLSVAMINALPGLGVSLLASSNSAPKFSVAQATAFENDGLTLAPYAGAKAAVSDTGANIAMLTPAQIGSLAPTGFGSLVSTSGGVGLSVIQAQALEIASLKVTAASGSKVAISDLAANIASLSVAQLAALSKIGVSSIAATDAGVLFTSLGQALALETPVIKVSVPGGFAVTASDTAATIQMLSATQISGLKSIGLTGLASNDVGVGLTVAEATALESAGISLAPSNGGADSILDTAAHIQALTAAQIAGLASLGVTQIAASDAALGLKTAQAIAIETAGIHVSGPGATRVSDTAANLQALTAPQISALPGIGATGLYSNNANVAYGAAQTSAIVSANLTLSAVSTHTVAETFSNGVTVTTAATGSGGSLTLSSTGSGSTVSVGPSTLAATSGGQTIPQTPHATEAITATGNIGDTFVFNQGFGVDTLSGFAATGIAPDLLEFEASMFSYLTPGSMTQTQEALAVLGNATSSGGNTTIVDSFGDTLTLHATSLSTLKANPGDFKFA